MYSSCYSIYSYYSIKVKFLLHFIDNILIIVITGTCSDSNIGNISSDVDKYTAIKVPNVITLAAYKLLADTENPHCGNIPSIPPY